MSSASYVDGWRRREAAERRRSDLRAAEARARLGAVVSVLVEQFGATRVVLFGSLADGRFTESSDIDVAVAGIAEKWFAAWEAAESTLGHGFRLDVIPIERARAVIREAIDRGEVLHGGR